MRNTSSNTSSHVLRETVAYACSVTGLTLMLVATIGTGVMCILHPAVATLDFAGKQLVPFGAGMLLLVGGRGVRRRAAVWGPCLGLTAASFAVAGWIGDAVPGWIATASAAGVLGFAVIIPVIWRFDATATVVLTLVTVGLGVGVAAVVGLEAGGSEPYHTPSNAEIVRKGRQDAQRDIANGKLRIISFGLVCSSEEERHYRSILADHGVEIAERGCVVTHRDEHYARAYNSNMLRNIDRRFGGGALERFWRQAKRRAAHAGGDD